MMRILLILRRIFLPQFIVTVFFGEFDPCLIEETRDIDKQPAKRGRPKGAKNKPKEKEVFVREPDSDSVGGCESYGERKRKTPVAKLLAKQTEGVSDAKKQEKETPVEEKGKTSSDKRRNIGDLSSDDPKKRRLGTAEQFSKKRKQNADMLDPKRQKVGLASQSQCGENCLFAGHVIPELDYDSSLLVRESQSAPKEGVLLYLGQNPDGSEDYSLALLDAGVSVGEFSFFSNANPEISMDPDQFYAHLANSEAKKKKEIPISRAVQMVAQWQKASET